MSKKETPEEIKETEDFKSSFMNPVIQQIVDETNKLEA